MCLCRRARLLLPKGLQPLRIRTTLMTPFGLNHPLKTLVSKPAHSLRSGGLGPRSGDTVQSLRPEEMSRICFTTDKPAAPQGSGPVRAARGTVSPAWRVLQGTESWAPGRAHTLGREGGRGVRSVCEEPFRAAARPHRVQDAHPERVETPGMRPTGRPPEAERAEDPQRFAALRSEPCTPRLPSRAGLAAQPASRPRCARPRAVGFPDAFLRLCVTRFVGKGGL